MIKLYRPPTSTYRSSPSSTQCDQATALLDRTSDCTSDYNLLTELAGLRHYTGWIRTFSPWTLLPGYPPTLHLIKRKNLLTTQIISTCFCFYVEVLVARGRYVPGEKMSYTGTSGRANRRLTSQLGFLSQPAGPGDQYTSVLNPQL